MIARPYQQQAVNEIELGSVNLIVMPQRSGKSYTMELAIDTYDFKKVLILVGYRKIVKQLSSYYKGRYTYILAGEEYDHSKQIHIASHQTFANRDVSLEQYDCIIIDEFHSRQSKAVYNIVDTPNCTKLLFTGTPLTNSNKRISKGINNHIQPITIREMLENGWLAPTRFLSNSNILGEHANQLTTTKQDFDESVVRQIIQKESLLSNIRNLILDNKLDTEHNTVIYVNYIDTAEQLFTALDGLHNVNIVHSKMTQKQQDLSLANYEADYGVLINVRALSLGWDSPRTDTLIYSFFTKIHSLALQILWRASTLNSGNPDKVATVYDMTGQLAFINPFTDFKSYSSKLSCKDQCIKQYPDDPLAQYFCMEACTSNPILVPCDGKLSYGLTENPFISNFTVFEGKPCKESRPVWEFEYKSQDVSLGLIRKWSKCKCGCVTFYDVKTLTDPVELIQVYNDSKPTNTVSIIYSPEYRKALAVFDDITKPKYRIFMFDSSEELYKQACDFFKSKPFQILSSHAMSKLPNVSVDKSLLAAEPAIRWESDNKGFIRQLIKAKFTELVEFFGIKSGYVYFNMKNVNDDNQKTVLNFLNSQTIDKAEFIKFFNKLKPKEIK